MLEVYPEDPCVVYWFTFDIDESIRGQYPDQIPRGCHTKICIRYLWQCSMVKKSFGISFVFHFLVISLTPNIGCTSLRFHFNKGCLVVQWSGDNPNSLAGEIS